MENSGSGEYTSLSDEEWLDFYESRAGEISTPETELLIKAAQWLVAARLELQEPEADKAFLRLHRGMQDSEHRQKVYAERLDSLGQFPEELRNEIIIEQFNIICDLLF